MDCAGFSLLWGLFSPYSERGPLFVQWLLLLQRTGSRAQSQKLWHAGLVAPRHVGSSWIRDRTRVSCIGRWILHHWATREALHWDFSKNWTRLHCLKCVLLSFWKDNFLLYLLCHSVRNTDARQMRSDKFQFTSSQMFILKQDTGEPSCSLFC